MKTTIPYQVIPAFKTLIVCHDLFLAIGENQFPRLHRKLEVVFSATPMTAYAAAIKIVEGRPVAWLLTEMRQDIRDDEHNSPTYTLYTDLLEAVEAFKAKP